MCLIHTGYKAIWLSGLNPYFYSLLLDAGLEIWQTMILCHVDPLMLFMYRHWRRLKDRKRKKETFFFSLSAVSKCHFTLVLLHSVCSITFQFPVYFGSSWTILITHPPTSQGLIRTRLTSSSTRPHLRTNVIPAPTDNAISWEGQPWLCGTLILTSRK